MLDIQSFISQLKRPKLLVSAARFGMEDYNRERDLRRALKTDTLPKPGEALMALSEIESEMNAKRHAKVASYALADHIDVLIAIMSEAEIFEATRLRSVT